MINKDKDIYIIKNTINKWYVRQAINTQEVEKALIRGGLI